MSLSDLIERAEHSFVKDLTHLCGRDAVACGDVQSEESHRMLLFAAARVLPTDDDDVFAIAATDPCVLQAPVAGWVFDDLQLSDTPANVIRAQIVYELWHALSVFYEAMQLSDPERLVVVVVGRSGLRLCSASLPDSLFRTQLLA